MTLPIRRRQAIAAAGLALVTWRVPAAAAQKPLRADDFRSAGQRGVGIGLLRFGNRSDADFNAVLALGATHVRVFLDVDRVPGAEAYRVDGAQLAALDAMLASLEQRGLHMVLVASFGADARNALWRSPQLQASVVQVWRDIAQRLRGRVGVGFDIVNEPVPPGITYAMRQDRWLELAARVIDAVRAVDPRRVVIVESAPDATGESFANLRPLPQPELVYSVHSYAPYAFTHQTVAAEHPQPRAYAEADPAAGGRSAAAELANSLLPVVDFARRHDVPIYVGEFSAVRWAPDDAAARYTADSIALFNRNGWSWAYHEFRAWHGWDPEIASRLQDARQRSADAPVLRALRDGLRAGRKP